MKINVFLRKQTKDWAPNRVESRDQFKERLLTAYAALSEEQINKGCADMARRLKSMFEADGTSKCIN